MVVDYRVVVFCFAHGWSIIVFGLLAFWSIVKAATLVLTPAVGGAERIRMLQRATQTANFCSAI